MSRFPNPIERTLLLVGFALARLGLIEKTRVKRTTNLAWPRIVTGLARMSKNAVDVAMVGVAVGGAAIGGVGIAGTFWGLTFGIGGGVAAGTIALVSQRYGAKAWVELGEAVRTSVFFSLLTTIPLAVTFYFFAEPLIGLISSDPAVVEQGTIYLKYVSFAIPFGALNLVGSRTLVGADDAYTAMVVRALGAVANIAFNAFLIFGLDLGVLGAALGTVFANILVTGTFAIGLTRGHVPVAGSFPVTVDPRGTYIDIGTLRDLATIGIPVMGRTSVWMIAELPMFGILDIFGSEILSAYVIVRRIWGLMNTPGWGFGLAGASLVGQEIGSGDLSEADNYGREIIRFGTAVYLIPAIIVAFFAEPIVYIFVDDPSDVAIDVAINLLYVACIASILQAVSQVTAGVLDGTGDTNYTFFSNIIGMFGVAIPVVYIGATTPLGLWGLYLAFIAEAGVPGALNYYRFSTGKWKQISGRYSPDSTGITD